ncbi:malectin domain-containing carbohydrate-binding protein, partial [uncultured Hymenobacter sp.]|uniref:malectin domain-containing carbohydrate-binding protein n=1 Tax=uncultured Hymenobacter sp. TaxID=170016 RepID=UPI0035CB58BA
KNRKVYTIDNGANQGWGGYPENEGGGNATNNYVKGEPGSSSSSANEGAVNNLDNLNYIGDLATYRSGSYYGGHPTPTRANPNGAGLYTHNGTSGVFRNSRTGPNPLPVDWPPVASANPVEGDFRQAGSAVSQDLLTFTASTNGMCEYTASNFGSALQGSLLACTFDGTIVKISLTADGTNVTNPYDANKVNTDLPFASGFGSTPLDVTAQGDNDIFPGTVWAATYGASAITVFEPQDFLTCTGNYDESDDDQDGYTNADEIDNGTQPCSAASRPADSNNNNISDLNDNDDDSDNLADTDDYFALDKDNGLATTLPVRYDLFNNSPGTGLFGLGFTGLMINGDSIYSDLFFEENLIAGGAVGAFSVVDVTAGDALGSLNTQENAFQFGVRSTGTPFTVQGRLLGPFFNNKTPQNFQSQGIYLGNGDQDNYLKLAITANGGVGGLEVVYENAGVPVVTNFPLPGGIPNSTLDFYFAVSPATGTVQPKYAVNGGALANLGNPIQVGGALLAALQNGKAYAVGVTATSRGASTFTASWDFLYVTASTGTTALHQVNAGGGQETTSLGTFSADQYFAGGNVATSVAAIAGTSDDAIYQSERYGPSTYSLPVPNGQYTVVLHFAEFHWTAAGQRVFDVSVEGTKVLTAYDIVKKAGLKTATTETFPATVNDGVLTVAFQTGTADLPKISAIEVLQASGSNQTPTASAGPNQSITLPINSTTLNGSGTDPDGTVASYTWTQVSGPNTASFSSKTVPQPTVGGLVAGSYVFSLVVSDNAGLSSAASQTTLTVSPAAPTGPALYRVNAGGGQVVNSIGTFAADQYASGGASFATAQPIAGTSNGAIYQSERYGNQFNYAFAVSSGKQYQVVLHFAEVYATQVGQRVFDVALEGNTVLDNYDIYKKAGAFTATTESFIVTVADDQLSLNFSSLASVGGVDNAKVSAIEIYSLTPTGNPVPTAVHRLNAGGGQETTSQGNFAADQYAAGGSIFASAAAIGGTSDDALYQTERYGSFTYNLPVSNGQYTVKLHFAELYWTSAGQRVFNVAAEGATMLSAYDIVKKVGPLTATTETFPVTVSDGQLTLAFLPGVAGVDQPKVSAIEVLESVNTADLRLNAGGEALTTSQGTFAADQYATGGAVFSTAAPIAGTSDDALYQTERYGNFTYNLPVPNGQYSVVLHFAELYWNAPGQRVFGVTAEGTTVLSAYDIVKKVGSLTATTETFPVTVSDGQLTLAFARGANGVDEPKVSAIEVLSGGAAINQSPNNQAARAGSSLPAAVKPAGLPVYSSQVHPYPNPSSDGQFSVVLPSVFQGEISYLLVSSLGATVGSGKRTVSAGGSQLTFDFSQQMPTEGVYYLHLSAQKAQAHVKLLRK